MSKKTEQKAYETPENKALNVSIARIYQKYGTDLAAFYRDVHDEIVRNRKAANPRATVK